MAPTSQEFRFDYDPGTLRCGRGCVAELGDELAARGLERALIVCGRTIGSTPAVVGPVRDGLGHRLADVFAETTSEKYLRTGVDAAERVREEGIDALVALGGGSSLDVARVVSALASHDEPPECVASRAVESGSVPVAPDGDPTPIVAVPTTLAGADLSVIGGVTLSLDPGDAPHGEAPSGSVGDPRLMPAALYYDLALYETTPKSVLCASAMNGFDKAVEALYSPYATPVTDGTAMRALSLMRSGFGTLPDEETDDERLYDAVAGVILAQYGVSVPGEYKLSVLHAFGHGFSHGYDVHQGTIHAIVAPHVLAYVFEEVRGRRDLLAEALGVADDAATDAELADAVVDAVEGVRDDLELPTRLRAVGGLDRDDLPAIAEEIRGDGLLDGAPPGLDPTTAEIQSVLERAW